MEIIFDSKNDIPPKVSIILLDWSVRESYHIFHYLNNQTVPREQYEIIWIEYYDKHLEEIEMKLEECAASNKPPVVDKWILMNMPHNIYYHKHLMYNIGIVVSKSPIITFMDSDAVVRPTFVESIIKSFENDSNIVLHMDQVRNINKRFYPFNYPPIDKITGEGCINLLNGKPKGLVDSSDPLHLRNYGSCMAAMRDDLISIGGADEHIDYLGHICGPYDMTFRLVNTGRREVWHQEEFLYHTWHPGTEGKNNYIGPHDGFNMSQRALSVRRTKLILPLVENPSIRALRNKENVSRNALLPKAISGGNMKEWIIDKQCWSEEKSPSGGASINMKEDSKNKTVMSLLRLSKNPLFVLRLYKVYVEIFISYVHTKIPFIKETVKGLPGFGVRKSSAEYAMVVANPKIKVTGLSDIVKRGFNFMKYLFNWPNYVMDRCWRCLHDLTTMGIHEAALFGTGNVAQVLCILSKAMPIKIAAVYDNPVGKRRLMGYEILPIETTKSYGGKVIIASFDDSMKSAGMLKKIGVDDSAIVDLW